MKGPGQPLIVSCGSGTIYTIKVDTNEDGANCYNMITGDGSILSKKLWFRLYTAIGEGGRRIKSGSAILTATGIGSTVLQQDIFMVRYLLNKRAEFQDLTQKVFLYLQYLVVK